jgi:hypothetical protein
MSLPAIAFIVSAVCAAPITAATSASLDDIAWLVGGTWTAEWKDAQGKTLFIDVTYRWADHRKAIAHRIVTRGERGATPTHEGLAWLDGATKQLRLTEVDHNGHATTGTLTVGAGRVEIVETMVTAGGASHELRAEMLRRGSDAFTFIAYSRKGGAWVHEITFEYRRSGSADSASIFR